MEESASIRAIWSMLWWEVSVSVLEAHREDSLIAWGITETSTEVMTFGVAFQDKQELARSAEESASKKRLS